MTCFINLGKSSKEFKSFFSFLSVIVTCPFMLYCWHFTKVTLLFSHTFQSEPSELTFLAFELFKGATGAKSKYSTLSNWVVQNQTIKLHTSRIFGIFILTVPTPTWILVFMICCMNTICKKKNWGYHIGYCMGILDIIICSIFKIYDSHHRHIVLKTLKPCNRRVEMGIVENIKQMSLRLREL